MRNKRLVVSILILAEVLLCIGIISISLLGMRQAAASGVHMRIFQFDRVSAEEQQEWQFEAGEQSRLVVECDACKVEISGSEGDEVTVTARKTAWNSSPKKAQAELEGMDVQVIQAGDTVTVRYIADPQYLVIGQSKLDAVRFTIRAPSSSAVRASTRSGDLSLSGVSGEASLESTFGKVTASDLQGALQVVSNGGSIEARRIQADESDIRLQSEFGDISLEGATAASLEAHTNSGDIRLNGVQVSGEVLLDSDFGEVAFNDGRAAGLTVQSNNGQVRLSDLSIDGALAVRSDFGGLSLSEVSAASYELDSNNGVIDVEGVSGKIKARSEHGSIQITRALAADLDLESNNGTIEFSGSLGDGPHSIQSEFGDIYLSLPQDSALTVDLETEFDQIESAFKVALSGEMTPKHWRGEINGGGAALTIKSNSGKIELKILNQ